MNRDHLREKTEEQQAIRKQAYQIVLHQQIVQIDQIDSFELVTNYKDAFDVEKLAVRYSRFFEQYDYLFGDLSDKQLRLKGFYEDDQPVANVDQIGSMNDYLYEYVNFGAPYFLLKNMNPRPHKNHEQERTNYKHRDPHWVKEQGAAMKQAKTERRNHFQIKDREK